MITSSLPPELKVMIASGLLLAGGLLASRFPAERTEEFPSLARSTETESTHPESSSTTSATSTSAGSPGGGGSRFETVEGFVGRDLTGHGTSADHTQPSTSWTYTSLPETATHDTATSTGSTPPPASELLSGMSYGGIDVREQNPASSESRGHAQYDLLQAPETELPPKPTYQPFQITAPTAMSEPNPAFFAETPLPSSLAELTSTSDDPGGVVSPSSVSVARPVTPSYAPAAVSPQLNATVPVMSSTSISVGTPVTPNNSSRQGTVIYAPAKTVIVPNY